MKFKEKATKKEACERWVRCFDAIPLSVVKKLIERDIDSVIELTAPGEYDDFLPMWGTVWTFDEWIDEEWARRNINVLQECGFRVYDNEDLGLFFGIDGAGYDFYKAHWIPLYEARGLQWHNED